MHHKEVFLHWDTPESFLVVNLIDIQHKKDLCWIVLGFAISEGPLKGDIFLCIQSMSTRKSLDIGHDMSDLLSLVVEMIP